MIKLPIRDTDNYSVQAERRNEIDVPRCRRACIGIPGIVQREPGGDRSGALGPTFSASPRIHRRTGAP
jgi:hypothetical protein